MARLAKPKDVLVFATSDGKEPLLDWLNGLKDSKSRLRILARIRRLKQEIMAIANLSGMELANHECSLALVIEFILEKPRIA